MISEFLGIDIRVSGANSAIRRGTYTYAGKCVRRRLADDLGAPYLDVTAE